MHTMYEKAKTDMLGRTCLDELHSIFGASVLYRKTAHPHPTFEMLAHLHWISCETHVLSPTVQKLPGDHAFCCLASE